MALFRQKKRTARRQAAAANGPASASANERASASANERASASTTPARPEARLAHAPAPSVATAEEPTTGATDVEFITRQERGLYPEMFDKSLDTDGRVQLMQFPARPPSDLPPVIKMAPEKKNHVSMEYGFVQHDFSTGVQKGETASGYGDHFCQVHGITRVFVLDPDRHLIAMCTPHRYMMFMANRMYAKESMRFTGNIFQFGGAVVAAPRWAMRAAATQILMGKGGQIVRSPISVDAPHGHISVSASRMLDGIPMPCEVVVNAVPYTGCSWVVMDKWMEDARSHKISIVVADTGLSELEERFDRSATLPLVIREDEADMFMCEPVTGLVVKDARFKKLVEKSLVSTHTKALQFRAGWYAPVTSTGVTRVMRMLRTADDKDAPKAADGSGPFVPTAAFSNAYVRPPGKDLWIIGGVRDVQDEVEAKELGTHLDLPVNLSEGSGGFNS